MLVQRRCLTWNAVLSQSGLFAGIVQLPPMALEGHDHEHLRTRRLPGALSSRIGQDEGIDAVRVPALRQLGSRLVQAGFLPQHLGDVARHFLHRSDLLQLAITPRFAHFEWTEARVPAALAWARRGLDILDDYGCDSTNHATDPFAAGRHRGDRLGRYPSRVIDCHVEPAQT